MLFLLADRSIEACLGRHGKAPFYLASPGRRRKFSPLASAVPIWEDGPPGQRGPWRTAHGCQQGMYDWLIIILVSLAGYAEAPGWFILLAAFGLSIEGWWGKLGLLRHSPRAISSKKTAYFVAGAIGNLGLAGIGYLLGHLVRAVMP